MAELIPYLAWIGVLITGGIFAVTALNPQKGLARLTHKAENLPEVMVGRYAAFALLALGAALSGDTLVISWLFAVFALVAFFDTFIYVRAGGAYAPHLAAGIAAAFVSVAALLGGG